jgi:hypothetical protein
MLRGLRLRRVHGPRAAALLSLRTSLSANCKEFIAGAESSTKHSPPEHLVVNSIRYYKDLRLCLRLHCNYNYFHFSRQLSDIRNIHYPTASCWRSLLSGHDPGAGHHVRRGP